jgi:hypothetical protein
MQNIICAIAAPGNMSCKRKNNNEEPASCCRHRRQYRQYCPRPLPTLLPASPPPVFSIATITPARIADAATSIGATNVPSN